MSAEPLVLASALYWAVYVIAIAVAIPCALALLFGLVQTTRWLLRGGQSHLPGRHAPSTASARGKAASRQGKEHV